MRCKKKRNWWIGRDPFNQNSNRSDREKWSTSKGGPVFSKLFRLDRTDPLSFGPKFSEILVEWIAPIVSHSQWSKISVSKWGFICMRIKTIFLASLWHRALGQLGSGLFHVQSNTCSTGRFHFVCTSLTPHPQCSPYKAVTGKIYVLQQHLLQPTTA